MSFDTKNNYIVKSDDGSHTAFSSRFNEHYHSTKDGALTESLNKHVFPAFKTITNKKEINILDICYGLGFNTLATIYYILENSLDIKVNIYSPEYDEELVRSLDQFTYPEEFNQLKGIVIDISETGTYKDDRFSIKVVFGDAREYLSGCNVKFDIIYQDAFSPSANPLLWTSEYFKQLSDVIEDDGVITTYSIAFKTRLALHENGFNIYLNSGDGFRSSTVATKKEMKEFDLVDMKHKINCNSGVLTLSDVDVL